MELYQYRQQLEKDINILKENIQEEKSQLADFVFKRIELQNKREKYNYMKGMLKIMEDVDSHLSKINKTF